MLSLPKFKTRYEAARYAVDWAENNPHTYVNDGGPAYPVPYDHFLADLKRDTGVTIVASAGCEITDYKDVFADVVNALYAARKCIEKYLEAVRQGKHGPPDPEE